MNECQPLLDMHCTTLHVTVTLHFGYASAILWICDCMGIWINPGEEPLAKSSPPREKDWKRGARQGKQVKTNEQMSTYTTTHCTSKTVKLCRSDCIKQRTSSIRAMDACLTLPVNDMNTKKTIWEFKLS